MTYNGTTIPYGRLREDPDDFPLKTWGYPGVDGVDVMSMGFRGKHYIVEGTSVAGAITKSTLRGFRDGSTHSLVESGGTHSNVLCQGFRVMEQWTDQSGFCFRFQLLFFQAEE